MVRVEPAIEPGLPSGSTRRACALRTATCRVPRSKSPSGMPAAAIASVTRATRSGPAAATAIAITRGCRWKPSAISSTMHRSSESSRGIGTRLAVVDGRHGVEQVGDHGRAEVQGRGHRRVVGVGVSDGGHRSGRHHRLDRGEPPASSGATVIISIVPPACSIKRMITVGSGSPQQGGVVGALALLRQERALQVDAGELTLGHQRAQGRDLRGQGVEIGGHQAGERAGRAVLTVELPGAAGLGGIVGGVGRAAATVHVGVDEAGHHPAHDLFGGRGTGGLDTDDLAVARSPGPRRRAHRARGSRGAGSASGVRCRSCDPFVDQVVPAEQSGAAAPRRPSRGWP